MTATKVYDCENTGTARVKLVSDQCTDCLTPARHKRDNL